MIRALHAADKKDEDDYGMDGWMGSERKRVRHVGKSFQPDYKL